MTLRSRPSGAPAAELRPEHEGIGRGTSPRAEAVSDDLRRVAGDFLHRRRMTAALTLGAMGSLGVVAAYQFGLIERPPDIALKGFDAAKVDASGEAYAVLHTPDAALGLLSGAVTLVLAGMGDRRRLSERPYLPIALAAKAVFDAASGAYLTAEQISKHRRLCVWCLIAAVANAATVPVTFPEARAAWRSRGRSERAT